MSKKAVISTFLIILSGMMTLFGSCRRVDNVVYSEFANFDNEGWDPVCVLPFSPWPMDSVLNPADRFDLILTLRYAPNHPSSEIPLEISEEDENGVFATNRLTVRLREKNGKPRGRKSLYLYEISDTLRRDMQLSDGYVVNIATLSPPSNTQGLRNLGLTLALTTSK